MIFHLDDLDACRMTNLIYLCLEIKNERYLHTFTEICYFCDRFIYPNRIHSGNAISHHFYY